MKRGTQIDSTNQETDIETDSTNHEP